MTGQIFLRKSVSLLVVHLLSCMHKRPLNYWHLFHMMCLLSFKELLFPTSCPYNTLLKQTSLFLLLLFKGKKISALRFCLTSHTSLLNLPQTQVKNRLGLFHWWLFHKISSFEILWFALLKRNCPFCVFPLTRNWLFVNLSLLAVTVSSDKEYTEGNGHNSCVPHLASPK